MTVSTCHRWVLLIVSALLLAVPAGAAALTVPGCGVLHLELPAGWVRSQAADRSAKGMTFVFRRSGSPRGMIAMTIMWDPNGKIDLGQPEIVRQVAEKAHLSMQAMAAEPQVALQPVSGAQGNGYSMCVTDKNYRVAEPPNPDDYPVMTYGVLPVAKAVMTFSIFSEKKSDVAAEEGLAAVRGASMSAEAAVAGTGGVSATLASLIDRIPLRPISNLFEVGSVHAHSLYKFDIPYFQPAGGKIRQNVAVPEGKAVLFLYDFVDPDKARQATGFAAGTLWGGPGPNGDDNDELLMRGGLLLVISGADPDRMAARFERLGFTRVRR